MLVPASTDGNEPGEPDARKPARPVRERVVGNVSTSRVRERRVSFQSLSPALLETRQRASYLFHETISKITVKTVSTPAKWPEEPVRD